MSSFIPTHRRLISGFAAVTVVVTANLLAAEAEFAGALDDAAAATDATAVGYELTPAPAPITGITGPVLPAELAELDDTRLVVPVLSRAKLELPAPPEVDAASIRAEAAAWLGDGVISAPTARIEVDAPNAALIDGFDAPAIDVPVLERPELAPPPVR